MSRVVPIELNSRVWIKGAEVNGFVSGILLQQDGVQYQVVYWLAESRRMEWMYAMELSVERAYEPS